MNTNYILKQRLSRASFLLVVVVAVGAVGFPLCAVSTSRPNVLIIVADQLAQKALGAYGNPASAAPNMDRLAAGGVVFGRTYTPCPLCQPARASVWTSRWPHDVGVLANDKSSIPASVPTMGSVFSDAGYEAVHCGKEHDAGALRGFRIIEPAKNAPIPASPRWPAGPGTKEDPGVVAACGEFLKAKRDRPFLMVADLVNPHDICQFVGKSLRSTTPDAVALKDLPSLPANFRDSDILDRPLPIQFLCCIYGLQSNAGWMKEADFRNYLGAYRYYTGLVDTEIGRLLATLAASPYASNTLVVLLADHGDGQCAHGMLTKGTAFYEETTRVPFIFAGPGLARNGLKVNPPLVSTIDLLPTLCDYTGIKTPDGLRGRSLLPWLRGETPQDGWRYIVSEWFSMHGNDGRNPGHMVRTDRYKYTRYIEGSGEELFDLEKDPGETRTLIKDPAYAGVLEEHRRILEEHLKATHDPFLTLVSDRKPGSHEAGVFNHVANTDRKRRGKSAPEAASPGENRP